MKRLLLSISAATALLALPACEMHSAADLPEQYQPKGHGGHASTAAHEPGATAGADAKHPTDKKETGHPAPVEAEKKP